MELETIAGFEKFEFELSLDDLPQGTVIYAIPGEAVELDGTDHKLTLHVGNANEKDFDLAFDDGILSNKCVPTITITLKNPYYQDV